MTRWVRSGSSQKHKKMPGNATKWGEFDNQYARKIPSKKENIQFQTDLKQKSKSSLSNLPSNKAEDSLDEDFFTEDKYCFNQSTNSVSELESDTVNESHSNTKSTSVNNKNKFNEFSLDKKHIPKTKKKRKQKNFDINYSSLDDKSDEVGSNKVSNRHKKMKLENDCSVKTGNTTMLEQGDDHDKDFAKGSKYPEESISQGHDKKKRKKMKNKCKVNSENLSKNDEIVENSLSESISYDNSNESINTKHDTEDVNSPDKTCDPDKSISDIDMSSKKQKNKKKDKMNNDSNLSPMKDESSSNKVIENKKEKYLKKLQKKRENLGLLPLPRNIECKLHKIKKRLIEKGFPPEKQKEIMRQARRREELKFRKVYNPSKLCFGCREPGHVLADCPKKSESLKQETGICFKCGSVEHVSFKCPENVQGYPYAKCFICKEQGHISRDCPKNKRGVYPKGGRCNLCGNVNHLKKDCPTLKKKENEDETITLHTLSEDASIDAEVVKKEKVGKKSGKKAKIVKF